MFDATAWLYLLMDGTGEHYAKLMISIHYDPMILLKGTHLRENHAYGSRKQGQGCSLWHYF